jgi:YesN/AraC family two-component response regulator
MIIEDEAIIALGLKKQLCDLGYSVLSIVSSGKEALDLIKLIHPDLVFVDINIPGEFNGLETARKIHGLYNIPLIICTGYEQKEIIHKTSNFGNCGYLFKPYTEHEVEEEIKTVFSRQTAVHH